jgi:hypothetical protein
MRWLLGEAVRDVLSGTTHALRYALALTLVLGAAVLADVTTVDALLARAAAYRDAGASVLTVEAPGAIDGATCDALADLTGVRAAGAIRQQEDALVPAVLPRGPLATYLGSPGLPAVLRAVDSTGPGVLLSADAAQTLDAGPGSAVALVGAGDGTTVRGTYPWPDDGRRPGYGYAALVPGERAEPYDACWVDAYPMPDDLPALARLAVIPGVADDRAPVVVSQLNTTLGQRFDGESLLAARSTRHAPWAALLGGAVIGWVAARTRRLELASARHVGVRAGQQHGLVLAETLVWVGCAALLVAATTLLVVRLGSGEDDAALRAVAVHVALPGLAGALLGGQAAVALTREAHLFRYFRTR